MSRPILRAATQDDLDRVVETFLACWRVSYASVLPPQLVARMTMESATALWTRVLGEAAPGEVLVADDAGAILGITRFGLSGGKGWVHSLYVSPDAQGRGIGRALLAAAEHELVRRGAPFASLWVFSDNAPSVAFYEARGWRQNGLARTETEFGEPEIGMTKSLGIGV